MVIMKLHHLIVTTQLNALCEASPPDSYNTLSPTPYVKPQHLTVTTHSVQHLTWCFTTRQSQHTQSNTLQSQHTQSKVLPRASPPYSHNTFSPTSYLKLHHLIVTTHSVQHLMWSFTTWQSQHTLSNTLPEASPPDSHNTLSPTPYSHNTLSPTPYLKRHHLTVTTHSVQHLTWSFTTRQSQHT